MFDPFADSDPLVRPVMGRPGEVEPVPRNLCQVNVWGEAEIRSGPGVCQVPGCGCGQLHFRARNKIVGQGLRHMINALLGVNVSDTSHQFTVMAPLFETNQPTRSKIRVGTGVGATTDGMTAMIGPNATEANNLVATVDNPSSGVYRLKFTATWNSNTLAAITVTEIGVFGAILLNLGTMLAANTIGGTQLGNLAPISLFARLSTTDGEFASFTVNPAVPLAIEYRVVWTFL